MPDQSKVELPKSHSRLLVSAGGKSEYTEARDGILKNISEQQLAAVRATGLWQAAMAPDESGESFLEAPDLRNMLITMGYVPGKFKKYLPQSAAEVNGHAEQIRNTSAQLIEVFINSPEKVTQFLDANTKRQFQKVVRNVEVETPVLRTLQSMILQQQHLDTFDLREITERFPLPITRMNYFGRFLASGCENRGMAGRHLLCAAPFFQQMANLMEAVHGPSKRLMYAQSERMVLKENSEGVPTWKKECFDFTPETLKLVTTCLNRSVDLGHSNANGVKRDCVCIELPDFRMSSDINVLKSVSPKLRTQLAMEIVEYIMVGEKSSPLFKAEKREDLKRKIDKLSGEIEEKRAELSAFNEKRPSLRQFTGKGAKSAYAEAKDVYLSEKLQRQEVIDVMREKLSRLEEESNQSRPLIKRQQLSAKEEYNYRQKVSSLETAKKRRREIREAGPKNDTKKEHVLWEKRLSAIEDKVYELRSDVEMYEDTKRYVKPVIKHLALSSAKQQSLTAFRNKVREAQEAGKQIVFVAGRNSNATPLLTCLDKLWDSNAAADLSSVRTLKDASFLLDQNAMKVLQNARKDTYGRGIRSSQLRHFILPDRDVNLSAKFVVSDLLPQSSDPETGEILKNLVKAFPVSTVRTPSELKYAAMQWAGKKKATLADCLDYTFHHTTKPVEERALRALLETYSRLSAGHFPAESQRVLIAKHNIPKSLFDLYDRYLESYRPHKLGELPAIFEDRATLSDYKDMHLDTVGMSLEVRLLEQHLAEGDGIVGIVDGTSYYPDLTKEIEGEKFKEDVEKSEEFWGNYTRPPRRLLQNLCSRVIEGEAHEGLLHHSIVSVKNPSALEKTFEKLVQRFYGIDLKSTPDMGRINDFLMELTVYDENVILILDADNVKDLRGYSLFVNELRKHRVKVIITNLKEPLPGVPNIQVQPFLDFDVPEKLFADSEAIQTKLELESPVSKDLFGFCSRQVEGFRSSGDDPLHLNLALLHAAAESARLRGYSTIEDADVIEAMSPIFRIPDVAQIREKKGIIKRFNEYAPTQILGQKDAIEQIGNAIISHLLRLRDQRRPLTLLLPGPTGVGKTEYMYKLSLALGIPFFGIEGAEFSEPQSYSKLIGSPPGYKGSDEGRFFNFLDENILSFIFIDEIEKMHPDVYTALMNFFDTATLTSGGGKTIKRPGAIIAGASNAAADKLHRGMSMREVRDVLSEAFVDRSGNPRPELVRRFDPIVMHAIEKDEFMKATDLTVNGLRDRYGVIGAGLRVVDIDPLASDLLYESSKEVCRYNEGALKGIGNRKTVTGFGHNGKGSFNDDYFFDLRHLSRALDQLAGESIREAVEAQYDIVNFNPREHKRNIRLYAENGQIKVATAA